jgi:hypothetical protein
MRATARGGWGFTAGKWKLKDLPSPCALKHKLSLGLKHRADLFISGAVPRKHKPSMCIRTLNCFVNVH